MAKVFIITAKTYVYNAILIVKIVKSYIINITAELAKASFTFKEIVVKANVK